MISNLLPLVPSHVRSNFERKIHFLDLLICPLVALRTGPGNRYLGLFDHVRTCTFNRKFPSGDAFPNPKLSNL